MNLQGNKNISPNVNSLILSKCLNNNNNMLGKAKNKIYIKIAAY